MPKFNAVTSVKDNETVNRLFQEYIEAVAHNNGEDGDDGPTAQRTLLLESAIFDAIDSHVAEQVADALAAVRVPASPLPTAA